MPKIAKRAPATVTDISEKYLIDDEMLQRSVERIVAKGIAKSWAVRAVRSLVITIMEPTSQTAAGCQKVGVDPDALQETMRTKGPEGVAASIHNKAKKLSDKPPARDKMTALRRIAGNYWGWIALENLAP